MSGPNGHGQLIELDAVTMTWPARRGGNPVHVLDPIDLDLAPGEFVCVAGRSGSGKTTLLAIAAALVTPTSGTVRWVGQEPHGLDDRRRARLRHELLGVVFQSGGLIPTLTAAENVALPGARPGAAVDGRVRASELLDLVGLAGRHDHYPVQLSGGEQQRTGIARALFAEPAALLVDEPTANLDRRTADEIIELLLQLRSDGRGLLVASHDPHLIASADRVVSLE